MLKIYLGDMPEAIYNTALYFKNIYLDEWLDDAFVQSMIKDVDKSTVLGVNAIQSPVLGIIPPTGLSGGVKTLILIYKMPDQIFNASTCGDNCAKWILKIAKQQDVTINLRHVMDFGKRKIDALILNNNHMVHNMEEFLDEAIHYV